MPTEKVGCILVTSHLQQFLEDYPPSSDKQAFFDVYHILSLLDKYLYDNPRQHTHCMSSDNKYVILLKYAVYLNICHVWQRRPPFPVNLCDLVSL